MIELIDFKNQNVKNESQFHEFDVLLHFLSDAVLLKCQIGIDTSVRFDFVFLKVNVRVIRSVSRWLTQNFSSAQAREGMSTRVRLWKWEILHTSMLAFASALEIKVVYVSHQVQCTVYASSPLGRLSELQREFDSLVVMILQNGV